jgi:hypothetical protein
MKNIPVRHINKTQKEQEISKNISTDEIENVLANTK